MLFRPFEIIIYELATTNYLTTYLLVLAYQ